MKKSPFEAAEVIQRSYGLMRMLGGGRNLKTVNGDLRILEIEAEKSTSRHYHMKSESIFHILTGNMEMEVDGVIIPLQPGDTIVIDPGEIHVLKNIGREKGTVIETMAPPYSKTDIYFS